MEDALDEVNKEWLGGELNFYFKYKRKIIEKKIKGSCLNVGCGGHLITHAKNVDYPEVDACKIPYKNNSYDTVVMSDVIEHIEDWKKALSEAIRVARKKVIITVPAYRWLWSDYDKFLGHYRRYHRKDFDRFLKNNSEISYKISYLFGALIPFLFIRKYTSGKTPNMPRILDNFFYGLAHIKLPFGSTLLLEIKKDV